MSEFTSAVLNPNSGEVALNMKVIADDAAADARRRQANNGSHDNAWETLGFAIAQDNQTAKHLATLGLVQVGQTGATENQQTVSPVRTGTGDAVVGGVGVAAETVAVAVAKQVDATVTPVVDALTSMNVAIEELRTAMANVLAQVQPKSGGQ